MSRIRSFWKCRVQVSCWQFEAAFVLVVLIASAILSGSRLADWIGAAAVFFTFMHGQISFDFQESQQKLEKPTVACFKCSGRYFVAKEVLWILTFIILQAWPLLVGTAIFATYPYWRKWFRAWISARRLRTSPVAERDPFGKQANIKLIAGHLRCPRYKCWAQFKRIAVARLQQRGCSSSS